MERSPPAPPESPDKAVETDVGSGSLRRFANAARHLFGLDRERFQAALEADEKERAARRALNKSPPGRQPKS